MTGKAAKPLVRALAGEALARPPWWLMRQAGRYLPEYREVRARARDFLELCLTPALAAELTLQPVRRYRMDAAILFSDILLLPHAFGQKLAYVEGEGPRLGAISNASDLPHPDPAAAVARLEPVFAAARRVAAALDEGTALIGFAGAPWTVAAYMVEGGGSRDFRRARLRACRDPAAFAALIDLLVEGTVLFLAAQIEAGAEAVQLFDSWAGLLPEPDFARWVLAPTRRIVTALKDRFPACPVIGFPRGAGVLHERYVAETGVDAVGLDSSVPLGYARAHLQPRAAVQGNLDPVLLLAGAEPLAAAVAAIRQALAGGPHVFNLGHGVLPETPPDNVALLARLLARPLGEE